MTHATEFTPAVNGKDDYWCHIIRDADAAKSYVYIDPNEPLFRDGGSLTDCYAAMNKNIPTIDAYETKLSKAELRLSFVTNIGETFEAAREEFETTGAVSEETGARLVALCELAVATGDPLLAVLIEGVEQHFKDLAPAA